MEMNDMVCIARRPNKDVYRCQNETVKLFHAQVPVSGVLNEALCQARAIEAGLPVPRLNEVKKIDGKWALVFDYADGDTLLDKMHEKPDGLETWVGLLVDLQMRVHAAQAPLLGRLREKLHRKISHSGLDATTRYELHVRLDAMPDQSCVLHGDFVPSNLILCKDKPIQVLDWAHASQGNPAADAATSYLAMRKSGEEEIAKLYLKVYCEKSDTARQHLEKWIPIVAGAALADSPEADRGFYAKFCESVAGEN
jgi:aminoglycoside phosphotransferase (APT) family kinase protein